MKNSMIVYTVFNVLVKCQTNRAEINQFMKKKSFWSLSIYYRNASQIVSGETIVAYTERAACPYKEHKGN